MLHTIRGNLILVLFVLLLLTLMIQAYVYYDKLRGLHAEDIEANLEVARAVARAFESFLQNIFSDEPDPGLACARFNPPSTQERSRRRAGPCRHA